MERFKRSEFLKVTGGAREQRCQELAAILSKKMAAAPDFHRAAGALVSELRSLGHDLWSFDESDDMEVWCPNYESPSGPGIVVTFTSDGVRVEWSER